MSIENTIDNLPNPEQFTDKLNALQQKIDPILAKGVKIVLEINKSERY